MNNLRSFFLITGNLALGIFAVYLYIYFWLVLPIGAGVSIHPLVTIPIDFGLFFIINFFILRKKQAKKYWGYGFLIAAIAATSFSLIIGLT